MMMSLIGVRYSFSTAANCSALSFSEIVVNPATSEKNMVASLRSPASLSEPDSSWMYFSTSGLTMVENIPLIAFFCRPSVRNR